MRTRDYEGMFLLNNHAAQADFDAVSGKVDAILEKHGATLVQKEKWDERKLAYEIKGQRRATYYLVYFNVDTSAMAHIREDLHLTEDVLRYMAFALDQPIEEHITQRTEERERLAEDNRRHAMSGWGGDDGRRRRDRSRRDGGRSSPKDAAKPAPKDAPAKEGAPAKEAPAAKDAPAASPTTTDSAPAS